MIFAALMTLWNALSNSAGCARVRSSAATSASTVIECPRCGAEDYFAAAFLCSVVHIVKAVLDRRRCRLRQSTG